MSSVMLHAIVLPAESRATINFRTDVILFSGVDAGVSSQMP